MAQTLAALINGEPVDGGGGHPVRRHGPMLAQGTGGHKGRVLRPLGYGDRPVQWPKSTGHRRFSGPAIVQLSLKIS